MTPDGIPALPVYGFDPQSLSGVLSLVVTVVLPLLVGLVTKRSTRPGVQAFLLLAFSAVKSFLEGWLVAENAGVPFAAVPVAVCTVVNFVIAVLLHLGLWRPTGVAGAAQDRLVKDQPVADRMPA